jgi:Transposase DDE domain
VLSRRARTLEVGLGPRPRKIKHLVFDSSGLKVFGEGEWKVRIHKAEKRRTWRELHISVDADTQQVTSLLVTGPKVVDPRVMPKLLDEVEADVERVHANRSYDSRECYRAIHKKGTEPIIPPRAGSTTWGDGYLEGRNSNVREVKELGKPSTIIDWLVLGEKLRGQNCHGHGAWLFNVAPLAVGRIFLPDARLSIYADAAPDRSRGSSAGVLQAN